MLYSLRDIKKNFFKKYWGVGETLLRQNFSVRRDGPALPRHRHRHGPSRDEHVDLGWLCSSACCEAPQIDEFSVAYGGKFSEEFSAPWRSGSTSASCVRGHLRDGCPTIRIDWGTDRGRRQGSFSPTVVSKDARDVSTFWLTGGIGG
jgi:hypothetical protein